jgi:hypothetical protein
LRPERRYCSKGCNREVYMDDPKRKEKNAAEQKVNYYTKKVLDLAKLKAVNADYQKAYDRAEKDLNSAKSDLKALKPAKRRGGR